MYYSNINGKNAMKKIKYNIHYGTKDIGQIFEPLINDKINEVTVRRKIIKTDNSNNSLSTNCEEKQEVEKL